MGAADIFWSGIFSKIFHERARSPTKMAEKKTIVVQKMINIKSFLIIYNEFKKNKNRTHCPKACKLTNL